MKTNLRILLILTLAPSLLLGADMLTPSYYSNEKVRGEIDTFLEACQQVKMHHPLEDMKGRIPSFDAPAWGAFGAGKGPTRTEQHHPAVDLKVDGGKTAVELFAAHDGVVTTVRDAPKYRNYISINKTITDKNGKKLGQLVTIYAHVDLDLDEADGLKLNGMTVKKGDLISKNLWSGTRGGPHLHFEIRYYRPSDKGDEEFYSFRESIPGAGDWPLGKWNPAHGFGFGHPESHGLQLN